jgi:subtilisin family serine protease
MHRRLFIALSASALMLAAILPAAAAAKSAPGSAVGTYIVQMDAAPAVAYAGGISGLAATQPAKGKKINPTSVTVVSYVNYLKGQHAAVVAKLSGATKMYDYTYSFNGFAARMTAAQAAKLKTTAGITAVSADRLGKLTTSTTPTFLGLDAAGGLWSQLGGPGSAGEDVIVGVVDTGIWPEHPSFSDQTDLKFRTGESGKRLQAYDAPPATWTGTCQSGEQFSQDMCTNKLIGARYYLSGFGHFGVIKGDYKSARDHDSHGSHTSSTAAGNYGVQATGVAAPFGKISGMAPRARIAAYKVCWNGEEGGCSSSDSVAAIDQAVADGVDVINFSISGTSASFLDPVEVSFLFAARAGIFVANSGGNSGPTASTVNHPSPWLTTVAASTHSRASEATLTLGNGAHYTGASSNLTATTGPVVLSSNVGAAGAPAANVALCFVGTLDPAKVAGKIVVCDRGVNARIDKSLAVKQAGGIGMILANTSPNSLNADLHHVPTIHIDDVAGAAVKAYVTSAGAGATATIGAVSGAAPAPKMAEFSSRGPSLGASGDLLKPDLTAPGVDILAAVSPDSGRSFDLLSGTSMSSPHIAGIGALMKDAHPSWSPAAIKSALMTSAYDTIDAANDPFAQGAGHVKPNSAVSPGLVYDAGMDDWRNFLKGQGLCNLCFGTSPATAIDASNLNLASIAIGDLAGVQTVTRRLTNVGAAGTYTASVVAPAGTTVSVSPSTLAFAAGETKSFTVTITRTTAPFGAYTSGKLTWTSGATTVRSPIVVRPVGIAAPATVTGTTATGTFAFDARSGFTGTLSFGARGLQVAATTAGSVADDPTNSFVVGGPGVTAHAVSIPSGTTYARFSLFDANVDGAHDLDLYVYKGTTLVGSSGSGTSAEEVNLVNPSAGAYTVYVHGWQTAGGGTANYTLFKWSLGASGTGTYLTLPASRAVTVGTLTSISVPWAVPAAGKYLGILDYKDGATVVGGTVLRVDAP